MLEDRKFIMTIIKKEKNCQNSINTIHMNLLKIYFIRYKPFLRGQKFKVSKLFSDINLKVKTE